MGEASGRPLSGKRDAEISAVFPAELGPTSGVIAMTRTVAEVLILTINALGAGILLFVAGVIQKIMNGMDEIRFKEFLNALNRAAMTDPFAVTIATLPIIAACIYFVAYGFDHWWFTAGFAAWLIGSSITKISNMPIYKWVGNSSNTNVTKLQLYRKKLNGANKLRAWITLASVLLMACTFGPRSVLTIIVMSIVITPPLVWLARRYIPN